MRPFRGKIKVLGCRSGEGPAGIQAANLNSAQHLSRAWALRCSWVGGVLTRWNQGPQRGWKCLTFPALPVLSQGSLRPDHQVLSQWADGKPGGPEPGTLEKLVNSQQQPVGKQRNLAPGMVEETKLIGGHNLALRLSYCGHLVWPLSVTCLSENIPTGTLLVVLVSANPYQVVLFVTLKAKYWA
jgi:hypothetical protein